MPTQAYVAVGIFITLAARALALDWLTKEVASMRDVIRHKRIIADNLEKLDRWEMVRPFIYRGYCLYARKLIIEMIESYEFLLEHKYETDSELLQMLKQLLNELPPDYDPPLRGGSLFVLQAFYARIGALQRWGVAHRAGSKRLLTRGCTYGSPAALGINM